MFALTLPEWLDPELLQWILLIVLAVVLYLMYTVIRFVQKMVVKAVLFGLLALFGLTLWVQRGDLQDCARTCECSLYGQSVQIPWEQLPDDARVRLGDGDIGCRDTVSDEA